MLPPSAVASLELVILSAGGYHVACPSDQVAGLVSTPDSTSCRSLESLLELGVLEPADGTARHYLQIHSGHGPLLLSLPTAPGMLKLDADSIFPLPKLLRPHCRLPGLVALGVSKPLAHSRAAQWLLIFDFRQW